MAYNKNGAIKVSTFDSLIQCSVCVVAACFTPQTIRLLPAPTQSPLEPTPDEVLSASFREVSRNTVKYCLVDWSHTIYVLELSLYYPASISVSPPSGEEGAASLRPAEGMGAAFPRGERI